MSRTTIGFGISPSLWKRSATRLLRRDDLVGDRADQEGRAIGGDGLDLERHAGDRRERAGDLGTIGFRPARGLCQPVDDLAGFPDIGVREIAVGEIERIGLGDLDGIDENAAALALLADREIRIPDRPGVDAAVGECRPRVGRRQIDRRDVLIGQPGLFQRRDHHVVGAGALGESDALALQVGDAANAGIGGNENALPVGDPRSRDIDDVGVRGLREDRRRIADRTEIDAADAHGLQQRRPRRELDPLDADLPGGEVLLQHGLLPRDHQHAGLLVADPDFLQRRLRTRRRRHRRNRRRAKRQFEELTTLHHNLLNDRALCPIAMQE